MWYPRLTSWRAFLKLSSGMLRNAVRPVPHWLRRPNPTSKRLVFIALITTTYLRSAAFTLAPLDFAAYATSPSCGAISISGNAYTDSFDSSQGTYAHTKQLSNGHIGVTGNATLNGSATVNGS